MGGAASKVRKITHEERIRYIKSTPFYLYLQDGTLEEFANCFVNFLECEKGETLNLERNDVYIVAKGCFELTTTMPEPKSRIEHKGYLCKWKKMNTLIILLLEKF